MFLTTVIEFKNEMNGLLIIIMIALVVAIIMLATEDAVDRGLNRFQIFLIRVAAFFTFPTVFIFYLLLRPSIKNPWAH
ncbi:hypothetical protein DGWBC_0036 [Dehalogenimonas sp. WBC-2]|nr:hypothetical protein DGWBC_0036 [Dehalogenimonas sp. WBC-2]